MAAEATVTGAGRAPARPGWWRSIVAVLGSSVVVGAACLVVLLGLGALHLVPIGDEPPGTGWPWRLDGAWAVAADVGPMLAVSFAFAAMTTAYLHEYTGVRAVRLPLALVAAIVGWLPLSGGRHGLLVVTGSGALLAVVVAARWWSIVPRRRIPRSRSLVAAVVVAALALAATSVSYGALHPLAVGDTATAVRLHHGRSERLRFEVENRGPLTVRVERIALVDDLGFAAVRMRIARVEVDSDRRVAPTVDGLFEPWRPQRLAPGRRTPVYLTLAAAACRRSGTSIDDRVRELDIRLRAAGRTRTQRVRLPHDVRVRCDTTGPVRRP